MAVVGQASLSAYLDRPRLNPAPFRRLHMRRRTVGIAAGIMGAAVVIVVAASCGDSTSPSSKTYVAANMNSANEGGNFTSTGTGTFTFVDLGTEFQWTLDLSNMTG